MNKSKIITLIIIIFFIISGSIIFETEFRKFEDLNINELLAKKYDKYQCEYIKSDQYYFIAGTKYNNINKSFIEIVRLNDDGTYFFFDSGIFPKKNYFKNYDIPSTNCSYGVFKEDEKYIIYISEAFSENNSKVYDNNGDWDSIDGNTVVNQKYWFKVIETMGNDYVININVGTETVTVTTKKQMEDIFS